MKMANLIELPDDVNPGGLLTIKKASEVTGIGEWTLRAWIRDERNGLRAVKIRRRVYLQVQELVRWLERNAKTIAG